MAELASVAQQFVLHWGEMGTRWGINRTVAQIHALLILAPKPLPADEIAQTLDVARSNVSTSIRELESWGLVRPVHVLGDRREHYEALKDAFEMFRIIAEQRKRRELDPTVQLLHRCLSELGESSHDAYIRERLADITEFFEMVTMAYTEFSQMSPQALRGLVKMRGRIRKLLRPG
ncbi:MAG TPA: MarR family transcriptional regulator [Terriglobales bacterium]|jgi:DNA-binding transcriptional regulator GbsR (MarR family)